MTYILNHKYAFLKQVLIVFFGSWLGISLFSCESESEQAPHPAPTIDTPTSPPSPPNASSTSPLKDSVARNWQYRIAQIKPGQGLFQALSDIQIDNAANLQIINGLRYEVELVSLLAGETFKVGFDPQDSTRIMHVEYRKSPAEIHHLIRKGYSKFAAAEATPQFSTPLEDSSSAAAVSDSLRYFLEAKPTHYKYSLIKDTIVAGGTLDNALLSGGLPPNLTQTVNGVLLCKISFQTDARAGDEFRVLIRNEYYLDTLIEGKVIYTSYQGARTGFYQAFRYDDGPQSSFTAHYTSDGEALIHSGLRYPVDRLRISSSYGWRIHPVTGGRAFHYGVDYAAGNNAPVYAVAPGKVVKSTYDKYSGNYIAIRHADNSMSYYLHLGRRGANVGAQVRSRQVIGTVGSTGRVTGPHLHFGFKDPQGKWMNPLQKRMIATPKLEGEHLQKLEHQMAAIFPILSDLESELDFSRKVSQGNSQ
jgi:murein DD-endopeptidase MepM/ murein hydrolase activator NlpD